MSLTIYFYPTNVLWCPILGKNHPYQSTFYICLNRPILHPANQLRYLDKSQIRYVGFCTADIRHHKSDIEILRGPSISDFGCWISV